MLARLLVPLCAVLLLCGCAGVETVTTGMDDSGLRSVNRAVGGKVVRMDLRDGRTIHVVGLHVGPDSVTWVDRKTNAFRSLPTHSVHQVSFHKTGAGAIRGLLFGVVVGAAFGGVRASMEGDDPISDPLALTREEKLRIYPWAHAAYAVLATTPIGAMIGTREVFRFRNGGVPAVVTKR